ncbi:MAG: DUF4336 domain-containing protein [Deltaproteobacteria bacterium]|nr:DUF4336 domain-containing protein [Deltaproteobacteria bacterium]
MLRELGQELWAAEESRRVLGVELGMRMSVARLRSGGLFLHAPLAPSEPLRAALGALGEVRCVVAPNLDHDGQLGAWHDAFPGARLFGPPGMGSCGASVAALGDVAEPEWEGDFEQVIFAGAPRLSEVVFYHRPSRSLLLADLAWHLAARGGLLGRAALGLSMRLRRFGPPKQVRWLFSDRAAAQRSLKRVLAWDFDRVIVCHGAVLETGGKQALARAYDWLSAPELWWQ